MSRHIIYWNQPVDFESQLDVVACVCVHDGHVLLLKRAAHKSYGNLWCLPAGKVEDSDGSLSMAAQRELQEETGLICDQAQLNFFKTGYVEFPEASFRYHLFGVGLTTRPLVHLDDAHTEWRWVEPNQALEMDLIPIEGECIKEFFKL